MPNRSPTGCQCGFSLLEVLVAFSITAVTLGVLYQIHAQGAVAVTLAGEYAEALSIAESKLAGVAVDGAGFELQGRSRGKYDWQVQLEDYHGDDLTDAGSSALSLAFVAVRVSWRSRNKPKHVALQTLKPFPHTGEAEQ